MILLERYCYLLCNRACLLPLRSVKNGVDGEVVCCYVLYLTDSRSRPGVVHRACSVRERFVY